MLSEAKLSLPNLLNSFGIFRLLLDKNTSIDVNYYIAATVTEICSKSRLMFHTLFSEKLFLKPQGGARKWLF